MKDGCKGKKNLHTEEKPSFVYLCIGESGQRNHSLTAASPFVITSAITVTVAVAIPIFVAVAIAIAV
jgi:hypothetical protein